MQNLSSSVEIVEFFAITDKFPSFKVLISNFDQKILSFTDSITETEQLEDLHINFGILLDAFLTEIDQLDIQILDDIYRQYNVSRLDLLEKAESFVIEQVYDMLYFKITSFFRERDKDIAEASQAIKYLDLCQMGVRWSHGFYVTEAAEVLS